jgi:hypothetical protein
MSLPSHPTDILTCNYIHTTHREAPVDSVVKDAAGSGGKKAAASGFMGMFFGTKPAAPKAQDEDDQFKGFAFAKDDETPPDIKNRGSEPSAPSI